jgi:hypothetical protein
MVGSQREPAALDEAGELVRDTLDKDLEGLGRPLKVSWQSLRCLGRSRRSCVYNRLSSRRKGSS